MAQLNLALASVEDYRREAERRLPRALFDYLDGGAYGELTLARNAADFAQLPLRQRVLRDVSNITTRSTLFGQNIALPAALAPIGMAGLMARRAEVQAKRACDGFGIPFTLSTVSICSLEEVAAVSSFPFWFQLYMLRDRGAVTDMLQRAKAAGVKTLIFTVDLSVVGARYRDVRNGLSGNPGAWGKLRAGLLSYLAHPRWLVDTGIRGRPHRFGNLTPYVPNATTPANFKGWLDSQIDPTVTWKDIEWLRQQWPGDLIIKGVLDPEDALAAINCGADGIVVSNHGGRQLDAVASTARLLPAVVDAIAGRATCLVDSGIRSGQDVLKARALGADGVLIGRPWVYAVAAKGQLGVTQMLETFHSELSVSMALTGSTSLTGVDREILCRC